MQNRLLTAVISVAALCAATAHPAEAAVRVLDFNQGNYCRGGQLCTNNGTIDQTYGDDAHVNVDYFSIVAATRIPAFYYERGFGDLSGVLYAGNGYPNAQGQVVFTAAQGYEVSLLSFDVGCFTGAANCQRFDYNVFAQGGPIVAGSNNTSYPLHTFVAVNTAYFRQVALNFGTGDNVGLDNIRFDVWASAEPTAAVPEPATWAIMTLGFGGVGSVMRRRPKRSDRIRFA